MFKIYILSTLEKEKCISEVVRIDSMIIFHLNKLSYSCCVMWKLQGKFEIDHFQMPQAVNWRACCN